MRVRMMVRMVSRMLDRVHLRQFADGKDSERQDD
jgi:hypothetical protein